MRIFLFFVIILNLLYAGWEYLSPGQYVESVPALASDLKTLRLLNEVRDEVKQAEPLLQWQDVSSSAAEVVLKTPTPVRVEAPTCYTLGPFRDKKMLNELQASLKEYVEDMAVRKRVEAQKHRYWVYVPQLPSRKQARAMAKQLRAKNINDFYIVSSGGSKNSISLGHFKQASHASRRMNRMLALGFKAQTRIIYRDLDIYWLDYQVKQDVSAEFTPDKYTSEGVSLLVRECG